MTERLLSVYDLSDLTGWTPMTIYRKSAAGIIPGKLKLGSSLRFRESVIEKWVQKSTEEPEEKMIAE